MKDNKKLTPISGKSSRWVGLWRHEANSGKVVYTSPTINLANIKEYKGTVQFVFMKNRFKGDNVPDYVFQISTKSQIDAKYFLEFEDDEDDDDEERLYTYEDIQRVIHGVIRDVQNGYTDLIPSDYV